MLEQVEERDLFLQRIDDQWFRYHHLFIEFLRHRLERDRPERVVELHHIASRVVRRAPIGEGGGRSRACGGRSGAGGGDRREATAATCSSNLRWPP